jgi:hypothetical protein
LLIRINGDSSTSSYTDHHLGGDGSSASAFNNVQNRAGMYLGRAATSADLSNTFGANVFDLLDYASTNKNKVGRMLCGFDVNGGGSLALESAVWLSTSAVSSLTVVPAFGTNFTQYSSFALYGIRGGN